MSEPKTYSNAWFQPASQGNDEWGRHIFGPKWDTIKWIMDCEHNHYGELLSFTAVMVYGREERYILDRLAPRKS
jgi:hypothetical protein